MKISNFDVFILSLSALIIFLLPGSPGALWAWIAIGSFLARTAWFYCPWV